MIAEYTGIKVLRNLPDVDIDRAVKILERCSESHITCDDCPFLKECQSTYDSQYGGNRE
jgi:hypothetical protein